MCERAQAHALDIVGVGVNQMDSSIGVLASSFIKQANGLARADQRRTMAILVQFSAVLCFCVLVRHVEYHCWPIKAIITTTTTIIMPMIILTMRDLARPGFLLWPRRPGRPGKPARGCAGQRAMRPQQARDARAPQFTRSASPWARSTRLIAGQPVGRVGVAERAPLEINMLSGERHEEEVCF